RLAISPNGANLLAATSNVSDAAGNLLSQGGIWRSTDGGATWSRRTNVAAVDVDFLANDSNRAIVGELGSARSSLDGGQTWTAATFTPAIANGGTAATNGRVEMANARFTSLVYATVNQNNGEVYRSNDGGQSYTRVNTGTNFFLGGGGNQGWYDNTIWLNPSDPDTVIVGGIFLWRGRYAQPNLPLTQISNASAASAHPDQHIIVAHPGFNNTTNRIVYFGNDGGIYRTNDVNAAPAGTSINYVELNNNLGITQFYGAAGNAASGVIIGGTQDNGTQRFTGNAEGWTSTNGADGGYCAADPTDANFFFGESQNLGVFRSTNGGQSAGAINAGIGDAVCPAGTTCRTNFIAPLVLDPNDPNILLAGGWSLWRSQDAKAPTPAWSAIKAPIAGNPISAIAVSPLTSSLILVGHNNGDIFRTLGGTLANPTNTWTKIDTAALPNRFVTRLVIDTSRGVNWFYATFGGFAGDNIWRSTDNGQTWTDITGTGATGLPNVPVRTLVFHPTNSNLLYAGTEIGIFTSEDAGANWEPTQDGPANVSVDELFWMGGDLVAATHGRGLYRASGGVYVRCGPQPPFENGTITFPFNTVTEAINATNRYRAVWVFAGTCAEPFALPIGKRLELRSIGGPATLRRP
ncbi:MAG: WD40/YVTN/BNR-like repeat-containing protein, partial [Pyrinomonadaceae bacterium]